MPKLVCPKCECELFPELNGVGVIETMNNGRDPYKLWAADLWQCPGCSMQVVAGFSGDGIKAISEHFEEDFKDHFEKIKQSKMVVYDNERPKLQRRE